MKRWYSVLAALCLGLCSLVSLSHAADGSGLPDAKKSKLGLYLTAQEANDMFQKQPAKILFLDIRTRAEAMYVGMPTPVDALVPYVEHQEIMTEWDDKRNVYLLEPNQFFAKEVERRLADKKLTKNDPVILICRSGDRSSKASDLLQMHGFTKVYSVIDGFEGDAAKDGPKAGQRVVNGWKNAGLPWSYKLDKTKMFFPLQ